MVALNFPATPSNGDEFEGYVYDSTLGVWNRKPSTVAYTVSPSAPTNPNDGDVWFNEQDGSSYIYYVDGDSEQWVEIGGKVGATGATGANGADGADGRFVNSATKPSSAVDGDVWFNTNNGKIFVYYDDGNTSQWVESGSKVLAFDTLANLSDTNISSPADGQALVYDSSSSKWIPGNAAPSGVKTLDSDTIVVDFSDNIPFEQRQLAGNVSISGTGYSAGIRKQIKLSGDLVDRSISYPAEWSFVSERPVTVTANKNSILELSAYGTSASSTIAIWIPGTFSPVVASGGLTTEILIDGVTYKVHTFTSSGDFEVLSSGDVGVEYLVLSGGGGGAAGWGNGNGTGGGGAGGLLTNVGANLLSLDVQTYSVVVGAGGAGGSENRDTNLGGSAGSNGAASSFAGISPNGGGGGGVGPGGLDGGSGGGGGPGSLGGSGTEGQGNDGGIGASQNNLYRGGGGGGKGSAGFSGVVSGNGGTGFSSSITGTALFYAGGGGGGVYASQGSTTVGGSSIGGNGGNNTGAGGNGVTNRGSGGGGGGSPTSGSLGGVGGNGSSGIVIVRYPITDPN